MSITKLSICLIAFSILSCTNSPQPDVAANPDSATSAVGSGGDKGVGPVTSIVLEKEIKADLVAKGKDLFVNKCSACHKVDERYVGPALKGVTQRRKPEWIMNMILNPQEMIQNDATAKELLGEYMIPMTFQNVDQDQARALLEYFRSIEQK